MRFHIECRLKSLDNDNAWESVTGNAEQTFTHHEVLMFKADLAPDDFECGFEYRTRVHADFVIEGMEPCTSISPRLSALGSDHNPDEDGGHAQTLAPGHGRAFNFVAQTMQRAFAQGA